MTVSRFDPDAIMREVRAVADLRPPATTATLLQKEANRSNVAIVASHSGAKFNEASIPECSNVAIVAKRPPTPDTATALSNRAAEAAERAASIPRGYTRAELEAARLDARRLGYPGRTVH
jgi:hypothetical protein